MLGLMNVVHFGDRRREGRRVGQKGFGIAYSQWGSEVGMTEKCLKTGLENKMSSLVKCWLVQSRTSTQECELFGGGLELPLISCFQEMPEVRFQEALERVLGRTMCVVDGAVLLYAHPISIQAIHCWLYTGQVPRRRWAPSTGERLEGKCHWTLVV